jgi:hypothetical protein
MSNDRFEVDKCSFEVSGFVDDLLRDIVLMGVEAQQFTKREPGARIEQALP